MCGTLLALSTLTIMAGATIAPGLPRMQQHFADVPLVIAAALELTFQAVTDSWTQLCQFLAHKRMLLVLDNLERSHSSFPHYQMAMAQQLESQARTTLGRAAADAAQQRGRAMSLDEVHDFARETFALPTKHVVVLSTFAVL
jgi:predicted ATPase